MTAKVIGRGDWSENPMLISNEDSEDDQTSEAKIW
jgi:hypothetical protein